MENQATPEVDNSAAQDSGIITPDQTTTTSGDKDAATAVITPDASTDAGSVASSWKDALSADLKGSPLVGKFEDTSDGLNKMMESHANLEQLLGHEKVPIPKGIDDIEGWNRFSKAMGIPDKAENYGLSDSSLPESMKGMTIDKSQFADIVHAHKLTPAQASGLWKAYNDVSINSYQSHVKAQEDQLTDTVNRLRGEWGDAYDVNVELGQTVINKFSSDQEANDYLTTILSQDPRGIKFLAKIGEQFAENKVGEFQMKRFSLAPEEAQNEIDKMNRDLEGPYMNTKGKHTDQEHEAAVARRNMLQTTINRAGSQV